MTNIATNLSKYRILVVDDEPDNLELLKIALEAMHKAVVCTVSGALQALERLEPFQPSVIITDIAMPQQDGFSLLKSLRQRPISQPLPIIAVTAHAMQGDREKILAAGFDGYISKPFDVRTVGIQLEKLLNDFLNTHPGCLKVSFEVSMRLNDPPKTSTEG